MKDEVILYLTHKISDAVFIEFEQLKRTAGNRDVVFLYNGLDNDELPKPYFSFVKKDLWELGYPKIGKKIVPGHVHFAFFAYFRKHTSYEYYWIIEYDVRFTGRWSKLFDHFRSKEADFISAMLRRYKDQPNWPWWELTHPLEKIDREERIRCFTPIYRISYAAANYLDNTFVKGWKGHAEVIIPTLLHKSGFSLMDFGGSGEFVKGKCNKFYTNFSFFNGLYTAGTFKYRPVQNKAGFQKDKLYHPVKPNSNAGIIHNLRFLKHKLHKRYNHHDN